MKQLFFNHKTKTIILSNDGIFYNMQNGEKVEVKRKLPLLKPFNKEYKTKWFPNNYNLINQTITFNEDLNLYIEVQNDMYRLSGKFPYYFLKTFNKLLNNGTFI